MTCSTGTSGPSSAVGSPGLPPAANAVVHTITAGASRANAAVMNAAASGSLRRVTNSGAGARSRAESASHSASIGAMSAASSIER